MVVPASPEPAAAQSPTADQGDEIEVEMDADVCSPIREAELRTLTLDGCNTLTTVTLHSAMSSMY
jgi:hypothetical protein